MLQVRAVAEAEAEEEALDGVEQGPRVANVQ